MSAVGYTNEAMLGQFLRDRRIERELSLRELARRVERSPSFLSDIEHGRREPGRTTLHALCLELEISGETVHKILGKPSPMLLVYLAMHTDRLMELELEAEEASPVASGGVRAE